MDNSDKDNEKENAMYLLQIKENLRNHWSGYIYSLLGFNIIANAAIWSIFIYSFTQNFHDPAAWISSGLFSAGLSCISLGIWRWYSKAIDQSVANIYPEILHYERMVGVSKERGILNYLKWNAGIGKLIDNISDEHIENAIKKLVEMKKIGGRGHEKIDIVVLCFISLFAIIDVIVLFLGACCGLGVNMFIVGISLFLIILGGLMSYYAYVNYQRKPSETDLGIVESHFIVNQ